MWPGRFPPPGLVSLDLQLHLLLNCSSVPFCPLRSHACHHPFYLPEDFFFAVLPLSALRVVTPGFSRQRFCRRFGFFPLFGDLWQPSRNVWAPPQDGGRGDSHLQPLREPALRAQVARTSSRPCDSLSSS